MSRSRRKAIYKDKGRRKKEYWKIHRRANKQIVKHFYTSAFHKTRGYKILPEYDYFDNLEKFIDQGYDEIVAHYMAHDLTDHIGWVYYKMAGNCFQDQGSEPSVKNPRELVNDYDYSDFRIDYEFDRRRGYYGDHNGNKGSETWKEERNSWAKKLRRK